MRLIPLLALAALACTSSTGPNRGLEIRADVSPSTLHVGQTTTITVAMTNRSSQPRTVETNVCGDAFEVKDQSGHVVAPPPELCEQFAAPRTLAPGEQFTYSASWAGQSAVTGSSTVAPGTYTITGPPQYSGAEYVAAAIQILP